MQTTREQLIVKKLDELADTGEAEIPLSIVLDIKMALKSQTYSVETTYSKHRVQKVVIRLPK